MDVAEARNIFVLIFSLTHRQLTYLLEEIHGNSSLLLCLHSFDFGEEGLHFFDVFVLSNASILNTHRFRVSWRKFLGDKAFGGEAHLLLCLLDWLVLELIDLAEGLASWHLETGEVFVATHAWCEAGVVGGHHIDYVTRLELWLEGRLVLLERWLIRCESLLRLKLNTPILIELFVLVPIVVLWLVLVVVHLILLHVHRLLLVSLVKGFVLRLLLVGRWVVVVLLTAILRLCHSVGEWGALHTKPLVLLVTSLRS